jgi:1-phosphofructokinase
MTRIISVTANTAIDLVIEAEGLYRQDNLVAEKSSEFACGKGINVAKAVESLGHPVICLGFAGRQSAGVFDALNSSLLHVDLIAVEGKTRTNITLSDRTAGRETHIRTPGYRVTSEDCGRLAQKIEAAVRAGDIVILSGSLPLGAPDDFYRTLIEICRRKSAVAVLDSSGPSLAKGIEAGPDLIKPNLQELEALAGYRFNDDRDVLKAARALSASGVSRICVSLGDKGVMAVDENRAFAARVNHCRIEKETQIGCGDAVVAGLAVGLLRRLPWEDCVSLGVACGTANLYSPEPGRFDKNTADEICRQIEVTPIRSVSG